MNIILYEEYEEIILDEITKQILINIGAHVLAHNSSNNQTYNSEIISRTKT